MKEERIKNRGAAGIPAHVAIMMDGNGRWAKRRLLAREAGHSAGARALKALVPEAGALGVKYLTVFAFSTENWTRSESEVRNLMDLMRGYIQEYIDEAEKDDTRLRTIGDISRLDADLREKIIRLTDISKNKTGLCLNIAINYGGRDEIVRAARRAAEDCLSGRIAPGDIGEKTFAGYLDTAELPEIDLWIRTGGDVRLSNFLLYQLAYAEIYFTEVLWPDFGKRDLIAAIGEYQKRNRRFGGR